MQPKLVTYFSVELVMKDMTLKMNHIVLKNRKSYRAENCNSTTVRREFLLRTACFSFVFFLFFFFYPPADEEK